MAADAGRGAAFFDLDKTIIATSSTLAFGRVFYARGLISRRAMAKGAYAKLTYHLGLVDGDKMARLRDDLSRMVTGWDSTHVDDIVAGTLHDIVDPLVYTEALDLLREHQAAGRPVVVVSSSGEQVVGPIARLVGADHVVATRMVVAGGHYTGEVGFYAYGPAKAEAVRELAAAHGWDLTTSYAYSDSATDVPMLETVGHPCAVNPDRGLRSHARARGWPIRTFRHPVPLRRRVAASGTPVAAGLAGAALATVAIRWTSGRVHARRAG